MFRYANYLRDYLVTQNFSVNAVEFTRLAIPGTLEINKVRLARVQLRWLLGDS